MWMNARFSGSAVKDVKIQLEGLSVRAMMGTSCSLINDPARQKVSLSI